MWDFIKILRVFSSENMLTVYRALHIQKHSGGGQGVFAPAPIDDIDKKKTKNIFNRKFSCPNALFKFKNVLE